MSQAVVSHDSELLAALERRRENRKLFIEYNQPIPDPSKPPDINNTGPYPWQVEFHNAGKDNPERLLQAANRVGKTRRWRFTLPANIRHGGMDAGSPARSGHGSPPNQRKTSRISPNWRCWARRESMALAGYRVTGLVLLHGGRRAYRK